MKMNAYQKVKKKINIIKNRNGIKIFGCNQNELIIFTNEELKLLKNWGLIGEYMYHVELMNRKR